MKKENIECMFVDSEEYIYQLCLKFFYIHPECLNTIERKKLYALAEERAIAKIIKDCPDMSEEEAKSIIKMHCLMSSKIRASEVDGYRDLVFSAAEAMFKSN